MLEGMRFRQPLKRPISAGMAEAAKEIKQEIEKRSNRISAKR
ncbi:hypothetical protein PO124_34250 [Bacillus licheniformis]|nr:hypothetical protein [Bacillus licheniformis]